MENTSVTLQKSVGFGIIHVIVEIILEIVVREKVWGGLFMRFANPEHYAIEFSLRSLLNYYYFRRATLLDQKKGLEVEIEQLTHKINEVKNQLSDMAHYNGFEHNFNNDYCEGTMLVNSMLGMFVLPQQELFNDIKRYSSSDDWKRYLPVLFSCIGDQNVDYINSYPEDKPTPADILRHIKNAFSHNRVCLHPTTNDNESLEVTNIDISDHEDVYKKDHGKRVKEYNEDTGKEEYIKIGEYDCRISIPKESFADFIFELQEFLVEIDGRRNHN